MAWFTVRVILHGASSFADYAELHRAMEDLGFSRQRTADDGTVWHLPDGEYEICGDYTDSHIYSLAIAAANSTGFTFAVDVIRAASRMWSGFRPVVPVRSILDTLLQHRSGYSTDNSQPFAAALGRLAATYGRPAYTPTPALLEALYGRT